MENVKNLTSKYIGTIDGISYIDLTLEGGFPEEARVIVQNQNGDYIKSELVRNYADYNNNNVRTVLVHNGVSETPDKPCPHQDETNPEDPTIKNADFIITVILPVNPELLANSEFNVLNYPVQDDEYALPTIGIVKDNEDLPALIDKDISTKAFGDRIIELTFKEPIQNELSAFDFGIDYQNRFNPDGPISPTLKPNDAKYNNPYYQNINNNFKDQVPDITDSTDYDFRRILMNYYFRYYKSDDEGTLYEPDDKPVDWFGFFSGKDTTTKISPDGRVVTIQFDSYSLPTGVHELIFNYSKTFPSYVDALKLKGVDSLRLKDHLGNIIPIVNKETKIIKDPYKAKIVDVTANSKTELVIKFDKPVLCQPDKPLINGAVPEKVSRLGNQYDTLVCKLNVVDALPLGLGTVTVGSVIDACGYVTKGGLFEVNVKAIIPEVLGVTQVTSASEDITTLEILFDDATMLFTSKNLNEYISFKQKVDNIYVDFPTNITMVLTPPQKGEKLKIDITNPKLYGNTVYQITIKDFVNEVNTVMKTYIGELLIVDKTAPVIESILFTDDAQYLALVDGAIDPRKNKIIVNYNEPMQTKGPHAITCGDNYKLLVGHLDFNQCEADKELILDCNNVATINILPDSPDKGVLIDIDAQRAKNELEQDLTFASGVQILKPGYCALQEIKYVTNLSDNILDFVCPAEHVIVKNITITEVNFTQITAITEFEVILTATINEKYQKLTKVDPTKFKIDGTEITAIKTEFINVNSFKLTFPTEVFVGTSQKIAISAGAFEDVFSNTVNNIDIQVTVAPDIKPDVVMAEVVSINGSVLDFTISFPLNIKADNPVTTSVEIAKQYGVSINDGVTQYPFKPCSNSTFDATSNKLNLSFDFANSIFYNYTFKVSTTVAPENIKTWYEDTNKPIEPISDLPIEHLIP